MPKVGLKRDYEKAAIFIKTKWGVYQEQGVSAQYTTLQSLSVSSILISYFYDSQFTVTSSKWCSGNHLISFHRLLYLSLPLKNVLKLLIIVFLVAELAATLFFLLIIHIDTSTKHHSEITCLSHRNKTNFHVQSLSKKCHCEKNYLIKIVRLWFLYESFTAYLEPLQFLDRLMKL